MRIVSDLSAEVPDTNVYSFKLKELSNDKSTDVLYCGYNAYCNNRINTGGRQVILNIWSPTEFCQKEDHLGLTPLTYNKQEGITEVYSICPYTSKWLNTIEGQPKNKYIFYPFNKEDIPEPQEKTYDVCYFGGMHSKMFVALLGAMNSFNYRYMSMDHHINALTQSMLRFATDINLTHKEKIKVVGQCRVSICINLVALNPTNISNLRDWDPMYRNDAFRFIQDKAVIPQFKSRMHEAAIAKTLNLVHWDPWTIAEDYYEAEKEFIYFRDLEELHTIIQDTRENWPKYEPIVEAAYKKAMNYTTENMIKLIETGEEWTH